MSDNDLSSADPLGQIADEFVGALQRGRRPSVGEFAQRNPAHADDSRERLPAPVLMEQAKSAEDTPRSTAPSRRGAAASARGLPDLARGGPRRQGPGGI